MKSWVDAVKLEGATLRVTAPEPLPAERNTLAVACALHVLERFTALDGLILASGGAEVALSRADVERLLAPDGFSALGDRTRWPQVLARAVQRHAGTDAGVDA